MMYKKIIMSAFAKAEAETPGKTKTQWADHLAEVLWLEHKYQVSRRTLLNYYNHYKNDMPGDLSPKSHTIEKLCKYLCYPDYTSFIMHQYAVPKVPTGEAQKFTYTLEGDTYKEQVTILIRREFAESLNVA